MSDSTPDSSSTNSPARGSAKYILTFLIVFWGVVGMALWLPSIKFGPPPNPLEGTNGFVDFSDPKYEPSESIEWPELLELHRLRLLADAVIPKVADGITPSLGEVKWVSTDDEKKRPFADDPNMTSLTAIVGGRRFYVGEFDLHLPGVRAVGDADNVCLIFSGCECHDAWVLKRYVKDNQEQTLPMKGQSAVFGCLDVKADLLALICYSYRHDEKVKRRNEVQVYRWSDLALTKKFPIPFCIPKIMALTHDRRLILGGFECREIRAFRLPDPRDSTPIAKAPGRTAANDSKPATWFLQTGQLPVPGLGLVPIPIPTK